ncbi:hypothetical protein RB4555 [Rhodopirellula baltica SH 1]|uniref:Uncharacterized protein n=1 Tax=Rhodopirellula baltica (strain DSM 10527 / NCIMB 13988 / SH1) TaxID=243090 RepID=Q7USE2_RHOBA|nr:hypothetical protein RB4555 [Rhodopirellula baltica SH 1]
MDGSSVIADDRYGSIQVAYWSGDEIRSWDAPLSNVWTIPIDRTGLFVIHRQHGIPAGICLT